VLRIPFHIASSYISAPLPLFLEVFKAVLVNTLWYAEELFCHNRLNGLESQHSDGLSMLIWVVGIRKNGKLTNLNSVAHAATLWFDVLTKILWKIMLTTDVHCHGGGSTSLLPTTQGNDVKCCYVNVAVHIFRHLDLVWNRTGQIFLVCLQYIQSSNLPDIRYTLCPFCIGC
jgi:hypothetical protein